MIHTPTPEQLQYYEKWLKDTYPNMGCLGIEFLHQFCEAYAHHKMMNRELYTDAKFKVDIEILQAVSLHRTESEQFALRNIINEARKVAALQEEVKLLRESLASMTSNRVIEVDALQQQLTEANKQILELKHTVKCDAQSMDAVHQELRIEKRFRIEDAASALDEQNRLHKLLTEANAEIERLKERMTRARNIITNGEPTPDNNWGILDVNK